MASVTKHTYLAVETPNYMKNTITAISHRGYTYRNKHRGHTPETHIGTHTGGHTHGAHIGTYTGAHTATHRGHT